MLGKKIILVPNKIWRLYIIIVLTAVLAAVLINTAIYATLSPGPLEGKRILVDPGHGGIDGGTNDNNGFLEKDINLQIALKLKSVLEASGAQVTLTRYSDTSLDRENNISPSRHTRDLYARVNRINSPANDIFVSVHINRSSNSNAVGPITVYSPNIPRSSVLANCIQDNLNAGIPNVLGQNAIHKPVKANLFILRKSNIPGVIVECGFISNPREKWLLKSDSYQDRLAKSVLDGVKDYFKTGN